MMTDAHYADPTMVALYDLVSGWSIDRDYFVALAGPSTRSVLDAGCGTGLVTVAYAAEGRRVVGLDPADSMLAVARTRPGGDAVTWICAALQDFRSAERFDLITMMGHAFQCLETEAQILATFQSVARLVAPHGRFVFDTRNPSAEGWRAWQPETSRATGTMPDGRAFEWFHTLNTVEQPLVSFTQTVFLEGEPSPLLSHSTLRFTSAQDLVRLAGDAGLTVNSMFGDWDRSPVSANSPELIVSLSVRSP